jgi:glycosyltransferase involved in cell wall biosynthesis
MGKPVLCNGTSPVLLGHAVRSNAALYYLNYAEFEACLELLLRNRKLRDAMGAQGKKYIEETYTWDQVIEKYRRLLARMIEEPWW